MHAKGWRADADGVLHAPAPEGAEGGKADAGPGHNSGDGAPDNSHLKSLVARIERLEDEKKTISTDIREVYGEAKSHGYDPKIVRKVIKLRARDLNERQEEETLIDMYLQAVGHKS
jgi:uncharacterized protein (UPF0335 family)